jgi:hypothetical protein
MDTVRSTFLPLLALLVCFFQLQATTSQLVAPISTGEIFSLFRENGKVGLKDQHGQVVIPAQHESIGWSDGSFTLIGNVTGYQLKGKWGLITIQNSKITKPEFLDLTPAQGTILLERFFRERSRNLRVVSIHREKR